MDGSAGFGYSQSRTAADGTTVGRETAGGMTAADGMTEPPHDYMTGVAPVSNEGKRVKVHYVGTLDDGTKFDSSRDRGEPLAFTCMAGQMIPGFDQAVRGMEVGQTLTVHLEPAEAYGEHHDELVREFPMTQVPEHMRGISVGEKLFLRSPQGAPIPATVRRVTPEALYLDMNHEMAGKALNFEIELLEVEG